MRGYLHTVLFLCFAVQATGQRLPFVRYGTAEGLPNHRCHVVRQDGDGYIWVGTDHGIARFDGRTFRHFPCPEDPYRSTRWVTMEGGTVVFSVDGYGIARCRGATVEFLKPTVGTFDGLGMPLPMGGGAYLMPDMRLGLVLFRAGRIDAGHVTRPPGAREWFDLLRTADGSIWASTSAGLIVYPRGNLRTPVSVPFYEGKYVFMLRPAPDGGVVVGSALGVHRYYGRTAGVPAGPPRLLLAGSGASSCAFDKSGDLWVTHTSKGLYHLFPDGHTELYGPRQGLGEVVVWDVFRDVEGTLWVTTENGLYKLSRQNVVLYDSDGAGASNYKSGLVWNDSTFLYSNGSDLYVIDPRGRRHVEGYTGVLDYITERMLRAPDGRLWMMTSKKSASGGFSPVFRSYRFDGSRLSEAQDMQALPGAPREIYLGAGHAKADQDLWLRCERGLVHYAAGRFTDVTVRGFDGGEAQIVSLSASGDGTMWLLDRGISLIHCRVDGAPGARQKLIPLHYLDSNFLKSAQPITTPEFSHFGPYERVVVDSFDRIYLGSKKGLTIVARLTGNDFLVVPTGDYSGEGDSSELTGISSRFITALCDAPGKKLWIGTASGMDLVDFPDVQMKIDKGLYQSELCGSYIYFIRSAGEKIFVGTTGCVAVIDAAGQQGPVPPRIYLTGLRVQNTPRDSLLQKHGPIRFGPDDNNFSFHFTGLSFADERGLRYRYRLVGLDDVWSPPSREPGVTYSRVPPGEYTFEVEAESVYGVRSATPAQFSFRVARPVWARWWFISLVVLSVGSGVYALYRYRIRQLMAIQRIRQKISKDLHDDIGATVSSIGILASIAQDEGVDVHKREHYLHTISDQSKYVAETLSDIVWTINPANDSLEVLLARVLRYATELFEARGIDYEVEGPPEGLHRLSLSMDARQNFYLILKEAINNLAKHSGATEARIRLYLEGGRFISSIEDNGRGFNVETATSGNGMGNLAKRAAALGAKLTVESTVGKGTCISLSLPAPK